MRELSGAAWLTVVALLAAPGSSAAQVRLKVIGADEARGTARAVVVEEVRWFTLRFCCPRMATVV